MSLAARPGSRRAHDRLTGILPVWYDLD